MPIYDDDELSSFEEPRRSPRDPHEESWDFDDGPDARDIAPDDLATVRCVQCKKLIFEDSIRCPYCKTYQLEARQNRKPLWFWATVIFCIMVVGGFSVLTFLGMIPWRWN